MRSQNRTLIYAQNGVALTPPDVHEGLVNIGLAGSAPTTANSFYSWNGTSFVWVPAGTGTLTETDPLSWHLASAQVGITGNKSGSFILATTNYISALYFNSSAAIGTPPYQCLSTTLNTNLNADLLDGLHAASFVAAGTAWLLDGQALGIKRTLGSTDGFDIGFITNNLERMTILSSNGNAGFGTTSPSSGIHLYRDINDATSAEMRVENANAGNLVQARWRFLASTDSQAAVVLTNKVTAHFGGVQGFHISTEQDPISGYTPAIGISQYNSIRLYIPDSDSALFGNIGIGTIVPNAKLEVLGGEVWFANTGSYTQFNVGANEDTYIRAGLVTGSVYINDALANNIVMATGGGNVSIGVNPPTATLELRGGTGAPSSASLKLDAGALLGAPETGALEFDGARLYFTPVATQETIAFLSDLTSGYVPYVGATANVDLGVWNLTANSLKATGASDAFSGVIWADGTTGQTPAAGAGTRFMWIPSKGAFRAGDVNADQWDDANIGQYSFSAGNSGLASGYGSVTIGVQNTVSGVFSTSFGVTNVASGAYAFATGVNNIVDADSSVAFGGFNSIDASSPNSTIFGQLNTIGIFSSGTFIAGLNNVVSNLSCFVVGHDNTATGNAAKALGAFNTVGGDQAIASGAGNVVSGVGASAFGSYLTAAGTSGFAAGYNFLSDPTTFVAGTDGVQYGPIAMGFCFTGTLKAEKTGSIAMGQDVNALTNPNILVFGRDFSESTQDSFNIGFGQLDYQFTATLADFKDSTLTCNGITVTPFTTPGIVLNDGSGVLSGGNTITVADISDIATYYLALDQTVPQTITASPIFNWGTQNRVPYYSNTLTLTDTANFTYDPAVNGTLSLNAGIFSTSGECDTGNILATIPPALTYGIEILADSAHPITATSFRGLLVSTDVSPANNATEISGTYRLLELKGTKDITEVYGDYNSISSSGGTGNSGTRTNTYAYYASILNTKGTDGSILALFYGANFQAHGTPTNCYGLRLPNISGGTNNYAIYTGTGDIRLGGTSFGSAGFLKNSASNIVTGGNSITTSDITDISTYYLKLDQTAPQVTTGTFTFPTVNFGATTGVSATATDGVLTLTGLKAAGNNENLTIDFETVSNQIGLNTVTGVTNLQSFIPQFTIQRNAIGGASTPLAGLRVENTTASTNAAKSQDSPMLNLSGQYWDGAQTREFQYGIVGKSISAGLRGDIYFYYKFGAGSWTEHAFKLGGDNTAQWLTASALNETAKAGFQNLNANFGATVGTDQFSPSWYSWGNVWSTIAGASQACKYAHAVCPEQGAIGTGVYKFYFNNINGSAPLLANEHFRMEWGDRVGAVFNDLALASYNFRIEGNTDTFLFNTQGATDRVGIGTSASDRKVEINDASGNCLRLTYNDANGSAANYADLLVASNGNLTIQPTGTTPYLLANKQVYGDMYADEQSQTVTVLATNTYYKVPGSMSGGTCNGFTFQNNDELKCLVAGTYIATWSMSVNCATNSQDLSGCVMINTTAQLNTTNHNFNGTGVSKNASIAGTGTITLAVNDVVGLCVANHTAIHDIIMEHANLTLLRVDA